MSGVALAIAGVYEAIKADPTTGGAMVAAGLAIVGYKETAGSPAPVAKPVTPTPTITKNADGSYTVKLA
jgi:hypothetical protein